jgi:hypothetical protein
MSGWMLGGDVRLDGCLGHVTAAIPLAAVGAAAEVGASAGTDAVNAVHPSASGVAEVTGMVAVIAAIVTAVPETAVIAPTAVIERAIEVVVEPVAVGHGQRRRVWARSVANGNAVIGASAQQGGRRNGGAEGECRLHLSSPSTSTRAKNARRVGGMHHPVSGCRGVANLPHSIDVIEILGTTAALNASRSRDKLGVATVKSVRLEIINE